jgi:dTDP-4-dehydrorhamnose reductase
MKKILITGSNGQLGSEIQRLASSFPDMQFVYTDVEELDLTDQHAIAKLFAQQSFDVCVNCAAYTAVDKAEDDRELAMLINATAVEYLAQVCAEHHVALVHVSTDYVFDGTHHQPYVETDQPSPNSYYGLTKLAGEKAVEQNAETAVIVRTAWLYSAFGNNFVKTMLRLGNERDELGVVVDQIGTPTYAGDLAQAILDLIDGDKIEHQKIELYHYSNEGVISWYDFAQAIMREAGVDCKINAIESKDFPAKANRPFYSVLNKAKIKSKAGLAVPYWLDSLKKVIHQLNNN